jgi:hypothetical protein
VGRSVLRSSGLLVRLALVQAAVGPRRPQHRYRGRARVPPVALRIGGDHLRDRPALTRRRGVRTGASAPARPDVALRDGRTLYEALGGGRFVLLGARAAELDLPSPVHAAAQPGRDDEQLVLVRPDGYVGWVGTVAAFPAWADGFFQRRHVTKGRLYAR